MHRVSINTYTPLDPVLQDVSKKVNLNDDAKMRHVQVFHKVLDWFREKIYEASPFVNLCKTIKYTGSYANNIKIGASDEFDVNICLKLPEELQVRILNSQYPAHVQLKTSKENMDKLKRKPNWETYQCLEKWMDKDYFILQNNVREWFESLISKIINDLPRATPTSTNILNFRKANPAFTLNVEKPSQGVKLDIDIAFSFYFEYPTWPQLVKLKYSNKFESKDWFVIPKPLKDSCYDKYGLNNRDRCWHIVFSEQEKEILNDHNNMKSTIRFMKQLRDTQNISYIKSYFINTIFMLEADKHNADFWDNSLSYLFMYMLTTLRQYVAQGKIPYYWYSQRNLLEKLSPEQQQDCVKKLDDIIKNINANYTFNPNIVAKMILGNN